MNGFDTFKEIILKSILMRRLVLVILISAAVPIYLLSFFLFEGTHAVATPLLTTQITLTIALTAIFVVVNAFLIAKSITRPLLRLTQAARDMLEEKLTDAQTEELKNDTGADEVHELARVFGGMAKELKLRQQKLKNAIREKGDFLNIASHELRTPLGPIIGYADLLLKKEGLGEEEKKKLRAIETSAQRLNRLVEGIIEFNGLETGAFTFDTKTISPAQLLHHLKESFTPTYESLKSKAGNKKPNLVWDIPGETGEIEGDAAKLTVALTKILDNAVKFTAEGTVTVNLVGHENEAEISVADTGVGISPEDIPRLFEQFFQGASFLTRQEEGVGLGLAIAKKIIEKHGGRITVESQQGKGSTFRVFLPTTSFRNT